MEISKSIERKYLHDMAVDQLAADYSQLGYRVAREEFIGQYRPDLVARNEKETIIFEVKTGRIDEQLRQKLTAFSDYVKQMPSHTFRVVFATAPQIKTIEIDNLEELLTTYLIDIEAPEALLELSSNTLIDEVSDVTINRINVSSTGELIISGIGAIDVTLQYGNSDGVEMSDSYPFTFEVILAHDGNQWQIIELSDCEVDTSSFYE